MRIVDVEIISMLMFWSASTRNIVAAMPGVDFMPGTDERHLGDVRIVGDAFGVNVDGDLA